MDKKQQQLLKTFRPSKILIPVLIGFGAVGYMFYDEFDASAFDAVSLTWGSLFWFFVAFLMMIGRDFGYIYRLRVLTGNDLSWKQCLRVVLLWEFTSAVTPSAIGGTSVAIYYVHKENLSVGKSSAIVMATSFLDELYFIIMFPLLILFLDSESLFVVGDTNVEEALSFSNLLFSAAVIGYGLKFFFASVVAYGLFVNPKAIKSLLAFVFSLKWIRKWQPKMEKVGDDLIYASAELKGKNWIFWLKSVFATFVSWSSRYWVVNCLFLAFFAVDQHFVVFGRQLVMWIMMLVVPTPGGAGFAEKVFAEYLGDFIPMASFTIVLALLWRMVSYYPYLLVGAVVFPRWMRKVVGRSGD